MNNPGHRAKNLAYWVRKYLVSAFVVASFAAYVLHERGADPNAANAVVPAQASGLALQQPPIATIAVPTAVAPTIYPSATETSQAAFVGPVQPAPADATSATDIPPTDVPPTPTDIPATDVPPTAAPTVAAVAGAYKDGQYTGNVADAFYGNVQVRVTIQHGKIADVQFVDYPQDRRRSVQINDQAVPWLQSEAIQAQSAQVDIISGATLTSQAFIESLQTALDSAKS